MSGLLDIPEISALDRGNSTLRIPDQQQVPLTPRIRRLIDTPTFQRLAGISQLGLVALVYPGARHTRFEHSLGVYRNALLFLRQLAEDDVFSATVSAPEAELFLVAALLHDLAHWPYCHAIEDMKLPGIPEHEELFASLACGTELPSLLANDWGIGVEQISRLLTGSDCTAPGPIILQSLLSGPIDVDKMDYLYRDSLHAGVPYGRNFDQQRLIGSLCIDPIHHRLAITDKGRTAAELMVFARYIMFSEVYWHHAVRSATAMLQRAFFHLHQALPGEPLFLSQDAEFRQRLLRTAPPDHAVPIGPLVEGIFGPRRGLYKRLAQFNSIDHPQLFTAIARQPFGQLVEYGNRLAARLSAASGTTLSPTDILIDAPPPGLEVQFHVGVRQDNSPNLPARTGKPNDADQTPHSTFRSLAELSPVTQVLATHQFDNLVKKVRLFVNPQKLNAVDQLDCAELLADAIA